MKVWVLSVFTPQPDDSWIDGVFASRDACLQRFLAMHQSDIIDTDYDTSDEDRYVYGVRPQSFEYAYCDEYDSWHVIRAREIEVNFNHAEGGNE